MALEQILNKRHYRRSFYIVFVLLLIVLALIRYFFLPVFDPTLSTNLPQAASRLADGIFVSLIVTVFIGSFIFWLTPDIMSIAKMEVVEPREIGPLLEQAMSK